MRHVISLVFLLGSAAAGCEDPNVYVGNEGDALTVLCRRGGDCGKVMHAANKLDLLLVVDDSNSMMQEQAALAAELPRMMNALRTGDIDGDGTPEIAPVDDIHVAVVSTDMGIGDAGFAGIEKCSERGDDAVLQRGAPMATCELPAQSFLQYDADAPAGAEAGAELGCLASLGIDGCGFEQQLEAALKAITPSTSPLEFWSPTGPVAGLGRGDTTNLGFLRNDPNDPSLMAVLLITDEDDCSSHDMSHFFHAGSASGLNVRCREEGLQGAAGNLYAVQRYVDGLRALRPDHDNLVFFGAIAGVPPQAVDQTVLAGVDFADDAQRDAFYEDLLAHPDMQETVDDMDSPTVLEDDGIVPACESTNGKAYPARRIVEVARGFGSNSVVQSICQESFTSAIEPILQRMAASFSGACIDTISQRTADGKVACDVLWRLPEESVDGVPATCADASYLSPAGEGRPDSVCRVEQLAVAGGAPVGDGWYYDDFSAQTRWCEGDTKQAIVFTGDARPPAEVTILIDCD